MMMENYLVNSRSDGKVPVSFAYRARNPMFVDRQQHLHGKYDNDGRNVLVWAVDDDGVVGMTGVIGFMS
jgi:hydroxyacyl-ACP dehydratase HTD2-like protein with hotdog domain